MALRRPFRPCPTEFAGSGADLIPALFVRRDEALLAAILTEEAGRLDAALEAAVQLLERFALACLDVHVDAPPEKDVSKIVPRTS
jgi:hypothetical protein